MSRPEGRKLSKSNGDEAERSERPAGGCYNSPINNGKTQHSKGEKE
jgi:hypothetical protein